MKTQNTTQVPVSRLEKLAEVLAGFGAFAIESVAEAQKYTQPVESERSGQGPIKQEWISRSIRLPKQGIEQLVA